MKSWIIALVTTALCSPAFGQQQTVPPACSGPALSSAELASLFEPGETSIELWDLHKTVWEEVCGPGGCVYVPSDLHLYHPFFDRYQSIPDPFPLIVTGYSQHDLWLRDGTKACETCGARRNDDAIFKARSQGTKSFFGIMGGIDGIELIPSEGEFRVTKDCARLSTILGNSQLTKRRFLVVFYGNEAGGVGANLLANP